MPSTLSLTRRCIVQNMPQHTLLTVAEEAELSKKVKDWLLMNQRRHELSASHGRQPTLEEWAASFDQEESIFRARLEDRANVSALPPPGLTQHCPQQSVRRLTGGRCLRLGPACWCATSGW